jgi:uncharacterized protein
VKSHAQRGAEKSYALLLDMGYADETAKHVSDCILSHSLSGGAEPDTTEAKILFDADKLDMVGAVGAARAIAAACANQKPMYIMDEMGFPLKGKKKEDPSLFRDYKQEFDTIGAVFYTEKAKKMSIKRQKAMDGFFAELHREVDRNHENGIALLHKYCT